MKHQRTIVVVMFLLCILPLLHAQELSKAVGGAYANVSVREAGVVGSSVENKGRYPGIDGGIVKVGQMVDEFRKTVKLHRIRVFFEDQSFKVVVYATPFICSVPGSSDSEGYVLWVKELSGKYRRIGGSVWIDDNDNRITGNFPYRLYPITTNQTFSITKDKYLGGRGLEGIYDIELQFFKNDRALPPDKISGKYMATVTVRLEGL